MPFTIKKSLLAILAILFTARESHAHPVSEAEAYRLAEAGLPEAAVLNISHVLTSPVHILVLTIVVVGTILIIKSKRSKFALSKKKQK